MLVNNINNINDKNDYFEGLSDLIQESVELYNKTAKYKIDYDKDIWEVEDYTYLKKMKINFKPFYDYISIDYNLITIIKTWILSRINEYSIKTINDYVYGIKIFFEFYKENEVLDFDIFLEFFKVSNKSFVMLAAMRNALKSLIEFFDDYFSNELLEFVYELDGINMNKETVRDIPSSKEVLIFSKIVKDYFKNDLDDRKYFRFKPIHLWWELTSIIPVRPIEFLKLKKNNFYIEKGKYYVEIERVKLKKSTHNISKVAISKEIYFLFKKYIERIEKQYQFESKYIFNYQTIIRYQSFNMLLQNRVFILPDSFGHIINDFYEKVIFEEYKVAKVNKPSNNFYEISQLLRMGDTRHLAFINLKRLGYHPNEIARIGGHLDLKSQNHYFNHVKNMVDLEILNLIYNSKLQKEESNDIDMTFITKYIKNVPDIRKIKLVDGYCIDNEMRCQSDDCWECEFWGISKEELFSKKSILIKKMNNKNREIEEVIDYLGNLYKSIDKLQVGAEHIESEELLSTSKRIDLLVNQYINLNRFLKE